jgi:hypothetical protein
MTSVKQQFLAAIADWFPKMEITTDPDQGTSLRVRLSERVYVEELGKERRRNPIIIEATEDVLSDLSHMNEQHRKQAFQKINGFVNQILSGYDDGLLRAPYVTTQPLRIYIPTSIY